MDSDTARSQAKASPEAADRPEPPSGAAGYALGATETETQTACTKNGGQWQVSAQGTACIPKDTTEGRIKAIQILDFCAGRLCWIHVALTPLSESSEAWLQTMDYLAGRLEERYGAPNDAKVQLPEHCRTQLYQCLQQADAEVILTWVWPSEHAVQLRMAGGNVPPALSVSYASPEGIAMLRQENGP